MPKSLLATRALPALLIVASWRTGVAQDTGVRKDSVPVTLDAVVVTATRAQTTLPNMPLHTTVITPEEISKSPAQTLDQLLRNVPGLNLSGAPFYTTDPTGHQTKLRGVSNSKVLVLLDGVPIHDPFFSTTQWFKVPLSSIERVEIVRGGGSSLWGNLAVAGVINIITRRPTTNGGLLDVSYQSLHTASAAASTNLVASHGLSFRLSGDIFDTDGYQTTPEEFLATVPGKSASSATNGNAQLAAYYAPGGRFSAFARGGYHRQDEDIGGYQFGTNLQQSVDGAAGFTARSSGAARADVKVWAQHVSFDKQNGAGCYLASASSCNTTSTASPLVQFANSADVNPYREVGASGILSTAFSAFPATIQGGVDFRRISGEDSATTFNRPTAADPPSSTINRTNYGQGQQQFIGAFTQFSAYPIPKLQATISARYDYWANIHGIAEMTRYTNGVPGATAGGPVADTHKSSFNPGVSVRYRFGDQLSLRGAAYRAFRAPGLNNLYRTFSSTTSITIANPNLAPETLTGAELGTDLHFDPVTIGATAFVYNTKALIASYKIQDAASAPAEVIAICGPTLSNCPATVNFNTNGQDAISRGLEFTGTWRVARFLTVDGAYTFTLSHYRNTTTGDPVGVQLGGIPKSLATLGVTARPAPQLSLYGSLRYSGSMYLDVNQTIPQKAFALVGFSASYKLTRALELYGAIVNVGDVRYSDNATTSAASATLGMPRTFTGGARWGF